MVRSSVFISLVRGVLKLDDAGRLTATINASALQYAQVDYWISLTVFDCQGVLLGAATHREAIQYIRLGVMPRLIREFEFDFGISQAYAETTWLCAAISDRNVQPPG